MQTNNFIAYLNNPSLILKQNEIKTVVDEFPYCQTTQLMYAYQLNKNNSILFDEQLKKAATYCTDRKRLFEQLHQEVKKEKQAVVEEQKTISLKKTESKKEIKTPLDDLEKNYLSEAISAEILLESSEIEEIPSILENKKEETKVNRFNPNITHTFSDWLKYFNEEPINNDKQAKEKTLKQVDLIAKFIQENPKIKPKKTAFYSPVNMARVSVVDNDGLVSETLALIHVEQGNYQAAINTYEKLSLKNPKKKSYFANQIKILKQKLK